MKKLMLLSMLFIFMVGCETIFGVDDDVNTQITVTGFGGSTSGNYFQRGYVTNISGPTIVRVKVDWSTSNSSGSVNTSPNVLDKGGQGSYYISYTGSGLSTSVSYELK